MGRLDSKVAVITGAASGMGRATALRFASEGAHVVLGDVDERGGNETLALLNDSAGAVGDFVRCDVRSAADVQSLIARALDRFGALDILFNNAGIEGESARLADQTEEGWDRVLAINLKGVFLGMKYGIPEMAARGGGSVINTASVAGLVGWHGAAAYSASKGGVVILTKTAALEYARAGVRVNCICPGVIRTPMVERITGGTDEALERLRRMQPAPRTGIPDDVAGLALYLASDDSSFVTGSAFTIDGGYTAR